MKLEIIEIHYAFIKETARENEFYLETAYI